MSGSPGLELFPLAWETPSAWAEEALRDPLALLSDHAHCELGAAASVQSMIARRPGDNKLVDRLAALSLEEMRHFRQVHRLLIESGGELQPARTNAYVTGLNAASRDGRRDPMLDRMLVAALIERRSFERFALLAAAAPPEMGEIREMYAVLGPSEAGHATVFLEMARERWPIREVDARFDVLREREGELLQALPFAPIIHSGPPA